MVPYIYIYIYICCFKNSIIIIIIIIIIISMFIVSKANYCWHDVILSSIRQGFDVGATPDPLRRTWQRCLLCFASRPGQRRRPWGIGPARAQGILQDEVGKLEFEWQIVWQFFFGGFAKKPRIWGCLDESGRKINTCEGLRMFEPHFTFLNGMFRGLSIFGLTQSGPT